MKCNCYKALAVVLLILATSIGVVADTATQKKPTAKPKVSASSQSKPAAKKTVTKKKTSAAKNKNIKVKPKAAAPKTLPRLLELGSDKCVPCKMMTPVLDDLTKEFKGKLKVQFVDVWKNREVGEKYKIKSIPTQIFFDSKGKEIFRHVGYYPKEDIIDKFKELGINFKAASDPAKKEGN